jgi:hypothetical protein
MPMETTMKEITKMIKSKRMKKLKLNLSILRETKTNQKNELELLFKKILYYYLLCFLFFIGKEKEYINMPMETTMKEITKMDLSKIKKIDEI